MSCSHRARWWRARTSSCWVTALWTHNNAVWSASAGFSQTYSVSYNQSTDAAGTNGTVRAALDGQRVDGGLQQRRGHAGPDRDADVRGVKKCERCAIELDGAAGVSGYLKPGSCAEWKNAAADSLAAAFFYRYRRRQLPSAGSDMLLLPVSTCPARRRTKVVSEAVVTLRSYQPYDARRSR
jgi:hypothetical protein